MLLSIYVIPYICIYIYEADQKMRSTPLRSLYVCSIPEVSLPPDLSNGSTARHLALPLSAGSLATLHSPIGLSNEKRLPGQDSHFILILGRWLNVVSFAFRLAHASRGLCLRQRSSYCVRF